MPFIRAGDIRIYYEQAGEGPRLMFINGSGGDLRNKPNMFDGPLKKHFTLMSYDQRGLGQTDKPDAPCSMAHYADDAAHLLDALGWDRCHVLGYSFGGMVAQEVAIRHGSRIEKLVLCASSPGGAGGASYPLHELEEHPLEARIPLSVAIHDTRHDAAWQAAHADTFATIADDMRATDSRFADEPGYRMGKARQLEARRHHDTFDRLRQIAAPTLICGGRYDGSATPEAQKAMADQIPGAELQLFEGGHLFVAQDRSAYSTIIEWLKS